jgi:hypothetical protein
MAAYSLYRKAPPCGLHTGDLQQPPVKHPWNQNHFSFTQKVHYLPTAHKPKSLLERAQR